MYKQITVYKPTLEAILEALEALEDPKLVGLARQLKRAELHGAVSALFHDLMRARANEKD